MNDGLRDPRFWRERAEDTRVKAESFRLTDIEKQRLLKIAEEYDRLAELAERTTFKME